MINTDTCIHVYTCCIYLNNNLFINIYAQHKTNV